MRLIDADALRKNAWKAERFNPDMLVIGLGFVLDAPTIAPRHGWTPCAEGLPESGVDCNVTAKSSVIVDGRDTFVPNYTLRYDSGVWHDTDDYVYDYQVIAWMPKPAPYNPDHNANGKDGNANDK